MSLPGTQCPCLSYLVERSRFIYGFGNDILCFKGHFPPPPLKMNPLSPYTVSHYLFFSLDLSKNRTLGVGVADAPKRSVLPNLSVVQGSKGTVPVIEAEEQLRGEG